MAYNSTTIQSVTLYTPLVTVTNRAKGNINYSKLCFSGFEQSTNSASLCSVISPLFLAMFCGGVYREFIHAPRSQRQIHAAERADGNR